MRNIKYLYWNVFYSKQKNFTLSMHYSCHWFSLLATFVVLAIFETLGHLPNIGQLFPYFNYSLSACRCGNQLKPEEIQAL